MQTVKILNAKPPGTRLKPIPAGKVTPGSYFEIK
jgi:hypothetical protein